MAELPKLTRWPTTVVEGGVKTKLKYVLSAPVLPAGLDIEMTVSRYVTTLEISGKGRFTERQMLEAAGAVEAWMRGLRLVETLKAEIARGSRVAVKPPWV